MQGLEDTILFQQRELNRKDKRITELEGALADAMGWNWHDENLPSDVREECQRILKGAK